jgi:BCD family chlorophyll transporter-like MFS transporter
VSAAAHLGWLGIVRLGLVQTALGAIVVLTTSTLNRVMVVELALPALVPGALVALHHVLQMLRPRLGHGSDVGGRRTPWIVGGMAVLSLGGIAAAIATAWMEVNLGAGIALAVAAFVMIGLGVGAAGTTLLALLAKRVAPARRAAAATVVWVMMIVGFIVTAGLAGHFLDPFSSARLVAVATVVCVLAFLLALVAVRNVEGSAPPTVATPVDSDVGQAPQADFRATIREVWSEPRARRFTIFVFVSMLAYSAQDLILEPFAGLVFGLTPGESTKLSGLQNGGVLAGMLLVGLCSTALGGRRLGSLRAWTIGGCVASAAALAGLAIAGVVGPGWPLRPSVFLLGVANGAFAVAAIGSMMALAGTGRTGTEGIRMGLWGGAQAIAFAVGGLVGTGAVDLARALLDTNVGAYAIVFAAEALVFLVAAQLAARVVGSAVPAGSPAPGEPMTAAPRALAGAWARQ